MKARQLIFIYDSGDPGFKFRKGSSSLFVIACIIFDDPIDAEFASASIKMLKKRLGWKQAREFKFHKTNDTQNRAFFNAIKNLNFHVRATVVDKTAILQPRLKKDDSFYQEVILDALKRFTEMYEANVFLDGEGGQTYRTRSVTKLRRLLNQDGRRLNKFRLIDSNDEPLIQLADMIAGTIRARYSTNGDPRRNYLNAIKHKVDEIYEYEG